MSYSQVEKICNEAQEIAERGGNVQEMVMDLLDKVGRDRALVEEALSVCEATLPPEDRAVQLLRNALATGLFDA